MDSQGHIADVLTIIIATVSVLQQCCLTLGIRLTPTILTHNNAHRLALAGPVPVGDPLLELPESYGVAVEPIVCGGLFPDVHAIPLLGRLVPTVTIVATPRGC